MARPGATRNVAALYGSRSCAHGSYDWANGFQSIFVTPGLFTPVSKSISVNSQYQPHARLPVNPTVRNPAMGAASGDAHISYPRQRRRHHGTGTHTPVVANHSHKSTSVSLRAPLQQVSPGDLTNIRLPLSLHVTPSLSLSLKRHRLSYGSRQVGARSR